MGPLAVSGRPSPPAANAPATAQAAARLSTVLVIDGDAVSRRFVELALGRDAAMQVEASADAASALEILSKTPVHLIVADTDLADPALNGSGVPWHTLYYKAN